LWRTSQICLQENGGLGLATFSEAWPRSGLMLSGTAYQLPSLVPLISEIECGLWRVQTPRKTISVPSPKFSRTTLTQEEIAAADGGRPCPQFREWVMGFPENWTALVPLEIPSSRKSRKSSGGQS
jgi:hypothetical protein